MLRVSTVKKAATTMCGFDNTTLCCFCISLLWVVLPLASGPRVKDHMQGCYRGTVLGVCLRLCRCAFGMGNASVNA
jgi:hypothetical protein